MKIGPVSVSAAFLIIKLTTEVHMALAATFVGDQDEGFELDVLMDHLTRHYTPKCLRVVIDMNGTKNISSLTRSSRSIHNSKISHLSHETYEKAITSEPNTEMKININSGDLHQAKRTVHFINRETARVTPVACLTYLLRGHTDFSLLALLTDPLSGKKLARYFLFQAQNTIDAEHILLDKRLGKEENVAALTHQESQTKTYWRVLIRQLLHPSGSPQVLSVNKWSTDTGLANSNDIFPDQMTNFYGTKLKGVSLNHRPMVDYEQYEGTLVVRPKPSIDIYILNLISQKLNFTYEIEMPPDGQWGYMQDDHWQGVVGEVESERANFSLILGIMLERAQSIDFSRMYFADPMSFMTAKSPSSPPWRKLITPFSLGVWLSVVVSVGGGTLLYHIVYHIQDSLVASRILSLGAVMNLLGSFLRQPVERFPWLTSGRVFLGVWFLYAFLVTTYYTTSLTGTLAVPFPPPNINTLDQLLRSGFTYGIDARKVLMHTLRKTT